MQNVPSPTAGFKNQCYYQQLPVTWVIGFKVESSPRVSAEKHAPPDFWMSELDTGRGSMGVAFPRKETEQG